MVKKIKALEHTKYKFYYVFTDLSQLINILRSYITDNETRKCWDFEKAFLSMTSQYVVYDVTTRRHHYN